MLQSQQIAKLEWVNAPDDTWEEIVGEQAQTDDADQPDAERPVDGDQPDAQQQR
jgi:hypothetical protein